MIEIGLIMGSQSDWEVMSDCAKILSQFEIEYEALIISAHRTPNKLYEYAEKALDRGIKILIAGAGGSAHLPGMLAAKTIIPVLGVPVPSKYLNGIDSLYSIVQMPKGIPVGTLAIGEAGAVNAGLLAIQMLAGYKPGLHQKLIDYREDLTKNVLSTNLAVIES